MPGRDEVDPSRPGKRDGAPELVRAKAPVTLERA